ncbi:putative efflux pump membrane fusion protein [compost metagenome]
MAATQPGLVYDTPYRLGEWVPAGSPVVRMLPPGNVKVRFYVPEAVVGALRNGQAVQVRCDGCAAPVAASITYVANEAEYTPPVIYSNETRNKLVFLVEARPSAADAIKLRPGQPVEVVRQ